MIHTKKQKTPKKSGLATAAKATTPSTRVTKKDQLIRLLSAKAGADIPAISETLGWQPHTTRAALTGLRKAGYELTSEASTKGRPARYRIVTAPSGPAPVAEMVSRNG